MPKTRHFLPSTADPTPPRRPAQSSCYWEIWDTPGYHPGPGLISHSQGEIKGSVAELGTGAEGSGVGKSALTTAFSREGVGDNLGWDLGEQDPFQESQKQKALLKQSCVPSWELQLGQVHP